KADYTTSYTIFMPTGRYADGATNNTGLGMWGHEIAAGTTVYLNEAKQYHAATIVSFDFQSRKESLDFQTLQTVGGTKVGTQMNLEGGVGGDFLKGALTAGLNYYAAFKLTADQIQGVPSVLIDGKNKVFALGPEVSFPIAKDRTVYGFLKVNYQW